MRFFNKKLVFISAITSAVLVFILLIAKPTLFSKADTSLVGITPTQLNTKPITSEQNVQVNPVTSPTQLQSNTNIITPTNTPQTSQNSPQPTSTPTPSNCHQVCQNVCN